MTLSNHPTVGTTLTNGYTVKEIIKKTIPFTKRFTYTLLLQNEEGKKRKSLYVARTKEVCSFDKNLNGSSTHYIGW